VFNRKTISVYHQQPFEIEVLDKGMRWAIVHYRNPQPLPKRFTPFAAFFILRAGQNFIAIGNERCPLVRVWQFKSILSFPVKKNIQLLVRKLNQTKPAQPHLPLKSPGIVKSFPLPAVVPTTTAVPPVLNTAMEQIHVHVRLKSGMPFVNENHDNPPLKTFTDSI
jgi:hypothetical protein